MKKLLALVLTLVMVLSVIPSKANNTNTDVTVYISVSQYGEIVKEKNDNLMAYVPINLSGKESYNLDDVFLAAHTEYYIDGEEGYMSDESDWGPYVSKLWGDDSGNFGYQVNGGEESVSGLDFEVENGDYIDACIYKNLYPDTEGYARFDVREKSVKTNEEIELSLSFVSGYDESWNSVYSPCENAKIIVNGEETEYVTDENGKVLICFENEGKYIISAKKSKQLNEKTVPAITAPVCIVTVLQEQDVEVIHNIAAEYKNVDIESAGGNLPWITSDMAIYEELFPEKGNNMSDEKKKEIAESFASNASNLKKPGDIAKTIIALRALGYDASDIYTESFEKVNLVSKLTDLIDEKDDAVTNIYTLPYVIIALMENSSYATEEQMTYLINSALESKDKWIDVADGTDAMTPMILALSPYCSTNDEVKTVVEEALEKLKSEQREDGLINGPEGYEPASTGLAITAISAVKINAAETVNGGNNLIEGLLSTANEQLNAFPNPFATEQGFRGLLAWQLFLEKGKSMYDFSEYPMNKLDVSGAEYLPVIFEVTPKKAVVEVLDAREISENCFDVAEGTYTYKVSALGYKETSGTFEVSAEEIELREPKVIEVKLKGKSTGGGGGGGVVSADTGNKTDQSDETAGDVTEEKIPEEDKEEEVEKEEKIIFGENTFSDVKTSDWYYNAVKYVYENNLFEGTDKGFEPDTAMSRAMLTTVLYRFASPDEKAEKSPFEDVEENSWYSESIKWTYKNKIVSGVSEKSFKPEEKITREQLAVIIYNYANFAGYDVSVGDGVNLSEYKDSDKVSDWASKAIKYLVATGILNGKDKNTIAPGDGATRAEVATIIMRFAEMGKVTNESN